MRRMLLAAVGMLCEIAAPAWAVDGIVLIDQNKAMAGNVTPGDTPGFPVTITRAGSYRLASNLVVPDANTSAIVVAANAPGVTIDLNGFSILGPTNCVGFPLTCTPLGVGIGVHSQTPGTTVRGGTIAGMGSSGIFVTGAAATVEDMNILTNGGDGMIVQLGTVLRNKVSRNGLNGINGGNAVISYNFVTGNRFAGISVNDSIVTNNTLVVNGSVGLAASNTGFASNAFSSNNGSFANPQFTGRTPIGPNVCDGNICP
ncbi:MAG TPA: hypothetical protein VGI14_08930 [Casimicrobiaceae bacterium]|jgi:hypothetical protein